MIHSHTLYDQIFETRCRRKPQGRRWFLAVLALLVISAVAITLTIWGCQPSPMPPAAPLVMLPQLTNNPNVRIRIKRAAQTITVDSPATIQVRFADDQVLQIKTPLSVDWSADSNRFVVHDDTGSRDVTADTIRIKPTEDNLLRVEKNAYPGHIVLYPRENADGFDVINHVRLEKYLPGVIERELYSHWKLTTYQAQSIAARSYAISELPRTRHRHFDLESTQASQVYGGVASNPKARRAVQQTAGMVLVYDQRVVPAFYSSCTGGTGQDATVAFRYAPDIPPLRGRYHGDWGRRCKYYRWGPIRRDRATLAKRIGVWGKRNGYSIGRLNGIAAIMIIQRTAVGRPARFEITDHDDRQFQLRPEIFRAACNGNDAALPKISAGNRLRSSDFEVVVRENTVVFSDGRGFGHGVGMDQFGAEAMARDGYDAGTILAFYYPEAELIRAY